MADLVLTEEHKQYRDLAHDFASKSIGTKAYELDHTGQFAEDICKQAWGIGLFNVRVPEEYGGLGLKTWDACIMAEELGQGCAGISSAVWANDIAVSLVLAGASTEQREKLVLPMMEKFSLAGHCLNDTTSSHQVKYKRSGDLFVLNGLVPSVNASKATWVTVIAEDDTKPGQTSLFAVPTTTKGFASGESLHRVGLLAADIRLTSFENVELSLDRVIGTVGGAHQLYTQVSNAIAPILASYAVGIMKSALTHAITYSKQRQTMGQPIGNHQAVGFMLADLAKDCEAARLMAWKAAWLNDNDSASNKLALMAKTFAFDAAMRGTTDAVQVYGGYGYSREYPVEKLMRDAKTLQVLFAGGPQRKVHLGQATLATVG